MAVVPALRLDGVNLRRDGTAILSDVTFQVTRDERWIVIGPNGCGKTSMLRIMALDEHPSAGTVEVLGERLGRTDVRTLKRRIGYMSASLSDRLRGDLVAHDVVRTARNAALEPWWHRYDRADDERADVCLRQFGVGQLRDRRFASLSSGERQRVLLARITMNDPAVVLLDEPSARLDLGGREQLVATLSGFASDPTAPPFVLVSHHVEEIPVGATHVAMMHAGRIAERGPIEEVLTAASLSECFGLDLRLDRRPDGRFMAWGA